MVINTSTPGLPDTISEDSVRLTSHKLVDGEVPMNSIEVKQELDFVSGGHNSAETIKSLGHVLRSIVGLSEKCNEISILKSGNSYWALIIMNRRMHSQ